MDTRLIQGTISDTQHRITHLRGWVGSREQSWSPISVSDAITEIEFRQRSYFSQSQDGSSIIDVVYGESGKYLRTRADGIRGNNLDELPSAVRV
jgi:hypothetical protein